MLRGFQTENLFFTVVWFLFVIGEPAGCCYSPKEITE